MANGLIFIGWNGFKSGMEEEIAKVTQDTREYVARLKADGKIESTQNVLLQPHGGDLNGFTLLIGENQNLTEVLTSSEFLVYEARWSRILDGLGIIRGYTGEEGVAIIRDRNARLFG